MVSEQQVNADSDVKMEPPRIGCGSLLGQYRLLELIGKGGFGCVYRARHELMDRIVALKIISPSLVDSDRARTWFLREVRASTIMLHPNIVTSYDADDLGGTLFLAMEYIDGVNLEKFVLQQGPLPVGMALEITRQAASALQHAHESGLVHRDVKPANLLVVPTPSDGNQDESTQLTKRQPLLIKLTDFGLARLNENAQFPTIQLNHSKSLVGTPHFIAPEQARDVHRADIRSDLYSLGCTLYFMLLGREPFRGKTAFEIVTQHYEKSAIPVETIRSDVPPLVAQILRRLMAKEPKQRIQTPSDLIAELASAYVGGFSSTFLRRLPAAMLTPRDEVDKVTVVSNPPVELAISNATTHPSDASLDRPSAAEIKANRNSSVIHDSDVASEAKFDGNELVRVDSSVQQKVTGDVASLRFAWSEWRQIIQNLCAGKGVAITEADYRAIHETLVSMVRSAATGVASHSHKKLLTMVAPWVSLRNLQAMDRLTLRDLETRSGELERELGLGDSLSPLVKWLASAALLLALVACAVWFVFDQILEIRDAPFDSVVQFVQTNTVATLAVLVPIAVLAVTIVFGRLLRK